MPKNKRRLQRHQRSHVLRNEARCVVRSRAIGRDSCSVGEATCRTHQAFATIHGLCNWSRIFLCLRVEFDPHSIGINIVKKDLNLENILLALLLNGRGTESQCRPVFREFGLPGDQIRSQRTSILGALAKSCRRLIDSVRRCIVVLHDWLRRSESSEPCFRACEQPSVAEFHARRGHKTLG